MRAQHAHKVLAVLTAGSLRCMPWVIPLEPNSISANFDFRGLTIVGSWNYYGGSGEWEAYYRCGKKYKLQGTRFKLLPLYLADLPKIAVTSHFRGRSFWLAGAVLEEHTFIPTPCFFCFFFWWGNLCRGRKPARQKHISHKQPRFAKGTPRCLFHPFHCCNHCFFGFFSYILVVSLAISGIGVDAAMQTKAPFAWLQRVGWELW